MPLLRFLLFLLTVLPVALIGFALLRTAHPRRCGAVVVLLGAMAVFAVFMGRHHENCYEFLDPSCYRALASAFAAGEGLHPNRPAIAAVPQPLRGGFFLRHGLLSTDGVFRYIVPEKALNAGPENPGAFRSEPCFLPMLPLAASALGRFFDAFPPLVGALWFLALLAFSLNAPRTPDPGLSDWWPARRSGPIGLSDSPSLGLRILLATSAFFATFFPSWFLRGFHADAIGAVLVSTAFLAVLAPPFRGRDILAGLCLGVSFCYHPTMVLFILPVVLYAVVREGRWVTLPTIAAGALPGGALALLQMAQVANPYFKGISSTSLASAFREVPVLRTLLLLVAALGVASTLMLTAAHIPSIRRQVLGRRVSLAAGCVLAIGTLLVPALLFAGHWLGFREAAGGIRSVHPRYFLYWSLLAALCLAPYYLQAQSYRSERLAVFLVVLAGAYGVYLKGAEIPVGLWSFRRMFPFVALMIPLCIKGAVQSGMRRPKAIAVLAVAGILPMLFARSIWFGVNDGGADRISAGIRETLTKYDLALFDVRERTIAFTGGLDVPVFGLPYRKTGSHWDRCSKWVLGRAASGDRVALTTSYVPCTLEEGFTLVPVHECGARLRRFRTKWLWPFRRYRHVVQDTVLELRPVSAEAAEQHKTFDGSPFGLRGPWKRANRGGCWSSTGCAIVGPVPRPGAPVEALLDLGWYDSSGTNPVSRIRITPPGGALAKTVDVSARQQIEHLVFEAAPGAPTDAPPTGLWRVEGSAVFRSAELVAQRGADGVELGSP